MYKGQDTARLRLAKLGFKSVTANEPTQLKAVSRNDNNLDDTEPAVLKKVDTEIPAAALIEVAQKLIKGWQKEADTARLRLAKLGFKSVTTHI